MEEKAKGSIRKDIGICCFSKGVQDKVGLGKSFNGTGLGGEHD